MSSSNSKTPSFGTIANIWKTIQEVDLRPIRQEAERSIRLAIVGEKGIGKQKLATRLRQDPYHPAIRVYSPLILAEPSQFQEWLSVDLVILMVAERAPLYSLQPVVNKWRAAGIRTLVLIVLEEPSKDDELLRLGDWQADQVIYGTLDDDEFYERTFIPAVLGQLRDSWLALGRNFPLFRMPIAQRLISETSLNNALYALSTGVAEVVPILNVPLNVADIVVLTKAQAFLVYRLGLLVGFSTEWQDYIVEFGSVLGGGFFWRQVARQLVGLIPVWGVVPKVAVAYAGTYFVGEVVLRWYLSGKHISKADLKGIYHLAYDRGRRLAGDLVARLPRSKSRSTKELAAQLRQIQTCPYCHKANAEDAQFCQYCGRAIS